MEDPNEPGQHQLESCGQHLHSTTIAGLSPAQPHACSTAKHSYCFYFKPFSIQLTLTGLWDERGCDTTIYIPAFSLLTLPEANR